ncbi:MAG: hypothetical protein FRX48_07042 [Lasallia pustulata]|uniref:Uncharacterized protein n=1 Tax=Lasallia pustulata TaxID=136370 RepID=A0A5M8PKU0_9LECA|nr:MAG: hypothetical protein FRX48_07042 [Lasallia pustulata]
MLMHLRVPTPMPGREQDATAAAMMRDILEAVNHVGNTEQEGEAAEAESPCTGFANPLAMQSALSLNSNDQSRKKNCKVGESIEARWNGLMMGQKEVVWSTGRGTQRTQKPPTKNTKSRGQSNQQTYCVVFPVTNSVLVSALA